MDVLEHIRSLPRAAQAHADIQAVIGRASAWAGMALLALRDNLQAIRRGADVDEEQLSAAVEVATTGRPDSRHAAAELRAALSAPKRQRLAAHLIARIDRAQAKAERDIARGAVPDALHEAAELEYARSSPASASENPVAELITNLFIIIMVAALIALLIIGMIVIVGVITLVIGASSGNAWLLGVGIFCMLIALILALSIFFDNTHPRRAPSLADAEQARGPRRPLESRCEAGTLSHRVAPAPLMSPRACLSP